MRLKCTFRGYLGLLVGLLAAAAYLLGGSADTTASGQSAAPPSPSPPSEQIDVEEAVDFPYDI